MIRKILAAVVLVPLALVMVALAVANRAAVTISFDPFNPASPAYTLKAPLFVLALILLAAGVIVGGGGAWLKQSKWRRAARRLEGELSATRSEADSLRRRVEAVETRPSPPHMALRPPAA
jgi:hypothetical protein